MLLKILIGFAIVVFVLILVIASRPSKFRIARTALVSAPAHIVFAQVNNFHHWAAWSPWAKIDPHMKVTFEGPPAGTGAEYSWLGNKQVGEGHMKILESRPDELIRIQLEFRKPFAATNVAEFHFKPVGNQTEVTWSMTGNNNFMFKAFGLLMNMDKLLGAQFEQGLAQMKTVSETPAKLN